MPFLTWNTLGALTKEASAEDRVAEKIPAVMIGPKPETMLITWRAKGTLITGFTHMLTNGLPRLFTELYCSSRHAASYIEVVLQAVRAAAFLAPAGGEVIAEFASGVGAVGHELRAERVVQVPAGVPHDAGAWREENEYAREKGHGIDFYGAAWKHKIHNRTCGNGDAQVDDSCDQYGQQGSSGDGQLWVLQHTTKDYTPSIGNLWTFINKGLLGDVIDHCVTECRTMCARFDRFSQI